MQYLLLLVVVASCGRISFDPRGADAGPTAADSPSLDAPPDVPVTCGAAYTIQPPGLASLYRIVTNPQNWHEAEANCELDGGHLPVVGGDIENDWLAFNATASGVTPTWLGLSDHVADGTFRWVTGVANPYTHWDTLEPNDANGVGEDCTQLLTNRNWNDVACKSLVLPYACECDLTPMPSTRTYCDTQSDPANCGQCGTVCPSGSCTDQSCN